MNKRIITFLKALISISLVIFLLSNLDLNQLKNGLNTISIEYLLLTLLFLTLFYIVEAIKNKHLYLLKMSFNETLKTILITTFYNTILPGSHGGSLYKLQQFNKKNINNWKITINTFVIERAFGFYLLIILSNINIFFSNPNGKLRSVIFFETYKHTTIILFLTMTILMICLKKGIRLPKKLSKHSELFYRRKEIKLVKVLPLITIKHMLEVLSFITIAKGLQISLSASDSLLIISTIYISAFIPISIGGLGVREGIIVYLLTNLGFDVNASILCSFLWYVTILVFVSIGGCLNLFPDTQTNYEKLG